MWSWRWCWLILRVVLYDLEVILGNHGSGGFWMTLKVVLVDLESWSSVTLSVVLDDFEGDPGWPWRFKIKFDEIIFFIVPNRIIIENVFCRSLGNIITIIFWVCWATQLKYIFSGTILIANYTMVIVEDILIDFQNPCVMHNNQKNIRKY